MSISEKLPLVADGSPARKLGVALLYGITVWIWLPLLPFIVGVFVWRNSYGWAETLDALPGIGPDGGLVAGGIAFGYFIVLFAAFGAVFGGGSSDGSSGQQAATDGGAASAPATDATAAASTPTAAPTMTPTPAPTATPTPTQTTTPTPTPTPTATPEPTPEPTPTPAPEPAEPTFKIRVEYDGEWQGAISVTGDGSSSTRSVSGSGTTTIEVDQSPVQIISANAQKQDDSGATLRIQILRNGDVVAEATTDAEYGVAQVSESFF